MARRIFIYGVVIVVMAALCMTGSTESDADQVSTLRQMQERSIDGVIRLDDTSVDRLMMIKGRPPCSYSLIILFDALKLRENNPGLKLEELRREFGLVASSYIKNNNGGSAVSKVFFVDIEFGQSPRAFSLFDVKSLPHIKYLPPGNASPGDAESMDQSYYARGADGMVAFIESKTKQIVGPINRPPRITNKQLVALLCGLLLVAPFAIKRALVKDTPLHDPKVWCSFALFVYYFSVSGGMHNIIRGTPFFMADRNDPNKIVFFYQGAGMQLGAEGYLVGFLYTIVGLMLAFFTHLLVEIKNKTAQRIVMLVGFAICYWAVRKVIYLDNWKTGYGIHGYWPNRWR